MMDQPQPRWATGRSGGFFAALETGRGALPHLIANADLRWLSALAVCGVLVVGLIASRSIPSRCQTRPVPLAFGSAVET